MELDKQHRNLDILNRLLQQNMYEGYLESNLWSAVNKRINVLYTKDIYILKLCLNIVTTRTEAPVTSGNKFLYACVKEVCCM
jgi:hypothetical protein